MGMYDDLSGASDPTQGSPTSELDNMTNSVVQPGSTQDLESRVGTPDSINAGATAVAAQQGQQPTGTPDAQPDAAPKNKWENLFSILAAGLSGGANAKNFTQGLGGGVKAYQEQEQQKQQDAIQQQKAAQEAQSSMDSHQLAQSQMATQKINQQMLAAQYNTMPKTTQDILDRMSMQSGETAKEQPGAQVQGTFGTYADAHAAQLAHMQANPEEAMSTQLFHNSDGGFDVISVPNPDKLNEKPVDVTIGYDFKTNKPITKTYAAGTISYAQRASTETNAALNISKANNDLEEYKKKSAIDQNREIAVNQAKADATGSDEWKPKVTGDEKKKAELAENIAYNSNEVNSILARRPDLIGKLSGRITNIEQLVGNNDPDISAIGNHIHNIAMANSGVHGFRNQEGVRETEANLLNNFHNGPTAVKGALNANTNSVQTFIDNARPSGYKTHSSQGGAVKAFGGGNQQQFTPPTQKDVVRTGVSTVNGQAVKVFQLKNGSTVFADGSPAQ